MTRTRGFSLVIVIVLGAAAFIVATTLAIVSESAGTRVGHSVQGHHATAIAEAGMERARSYLQAQTTPDGDFDAVLDPLGEADCTGMPTAAPTAAPLSQVLRPQFTDGTAVVYNGKTWTRVAYDGGAYLIRFEDDSDDFRNDLRWVPRTGNTPGATNCLEGPASLGTADNPFRDRNQTINVTVVGIAPGIDPERAVHRATLRRVEALGGAAVVAGIQVDGNIDLNGTSDLFACSTQGSLVVDGNLTADGSSSGCACGESRADNISGSWGHCTASPGVCPAAVGCATGTLDTPGPDVPPVLDFTSSDGKDFFFDWSRPCVFYVDADNGGLWFWDATANRGPGGVPCSDIEGAPVGFPPITPDNDAAFGRCWTPLLLDLNGAPVAVFGTELTGNNWTPNNTASAPTTIATTGPGYANFVPPITTTKPAWGAACQVAFLANPPIGCTTCDGATPAMDMNTYWFTGDTAAELHAIPAGVYYYDDDVSLTGSTNDHQVPDPDTPPTSTFDLADWPLMTVAVKGSLTLQTRTILGIGQADAAFASAILTGNFTFTGSDDKLIAGSVWSTGNWEWGGGSDNFFFGELHLNGNWEMNGNGQFHWRYLNALSPATVFRSPAVPTQTRSLD